ncbi:MAG TPA: hypothetical protein VKF41_03430 [Bryobacteraceae bacterium]|nr:hypothetical protein [Bryobacteraceae bacterium]
MHFLVAMLAAGLIAQTQTMTVANLMDWLRNPATAQESDAALARFLYRVKLADRLDDGALEVLRTQVLLGPKTMDALRKLRDQSRSLPKPAPPVPQAAPKLPPNAEEQAAILDDVRRYALDYSQKLPDFVCLEMERRSLADPPRAGRGGTVSEPEWRQVDTITKRVSYFEQKEDEKVLEHNHAYTTQDMKSLGGTQSWGDFGSMMRQVFEPATAALFEWAGWFRLGGQLVMGFDFSVPLERSKYRLEVDNRSIISAYRGRVNVDPQTHAILRVKVEAVNIPPDFPLRSASDTLYYENQTISGLPFLLPSQVEVRMGTGSYLSRNVKVFQAYRKYTADSSISFDDVPAAPPPGDKAKEIAEPGQPAR